MSTRARRGPIVQLTAPKRDLLAVVAREGPASGQVIRESLQESGMEIVYRTSYVYLRDLEDAGLVEVTQPDGLHGNIYQITRDGIKTLATHSRWLSASLDEADLMDMEMEVCR